MSEPIVDEAQKPLFDVLEIGFGEDAPPVLQQVEAKVRERLPEDADEDAFRKAMQDELGRLIAHHGWRLQQVDEQRGAQRVALKAALERAQWDVTRMKAQLDMLGTEQMRDTEHDRFVLDAVSEYLFAQSRRKSLHFGNVRLGTQKSSRKEAPELVDKARAAELLPDYTAPALKWGEAKKALVVRDGIAYTPDGEAIPADVVSVRPAESDVKPFVELPGKTKIYLREGVRQDGNGASDTAGGEYGPDDPFGDDAPDDPPSIDGAFDD